MKKLLAICALILCAALVFVNFAAVASAVVSPEASTYTTRSGRGGGTEPTSRGGGRTTKSVVTSSHPDNGENDPNSPNYTGERNVTSDKSQTSPDTASAQPRVAAVAAAGLMMAAACAVVVTKKRSAEEN